MLQISRYSSSLCLLGPEEAQKKRTNMPKTTKAQQQPLTPTKSKSNSINQTIVENSEPEVNEVDHGLRSPKPSMKTLKAVRNITPQKSDERYPSPPQSSGTIQQ